MATEWKLVNHPKPFWSRLLASLSDGLPLVAVLWTDMTLNIQFALLIYVSGWSCTSTTRFHGWQAAATAQKNLIWGHLVESVQLTALILFSSFRSHRCGPPMLFLLWWLGYNPASVMLVIHFDFRATVLEWTEKFLPFVTSCFWL